MSTVDFGNGAKVRATTEAQVLARIPLGNLKCMTRLRWRDVFNFPRMSIRAANGSQWYVSIRPEFGNLQV
jgi:hypothetical protein